MLFVHTSLLDTRISVMCLLMDSHSQNYEQTTEGLTNYLNLSPVTACGGRYICLLMLSSVSNSWTIYSPPSHLWLGGWYLFYIGIWNQYHPYLLPYSGECLYRWYTYMNKYSRYIYLYTCQMSVFRKMLSCWTKYPLIIRHFKIYYHCVHNRTPE